jgi:excisionase family DNA binding protein
MTNIQSLINSTQGANTLIMMSGEQLQKLIDDVTANTRRIVEEQYQPRYFTVEQMTELFDCQTSTIYNWMKRGKIKGYKMDEGGRTYFDQAEVREAMQNGLIGKYVHK